MVTVHKRKLIVITIFYLVFFILCASSTAATDMTKKPTESSKTALRQMMLARIQERAKNKANREKEIAESTKSETENNDKPAENKPSSTQAEIQQLEEALNKERETRETIAQELASTKNALAESRQTEEDLLQQKQQWLSSQQQVIKSATFLQRVLKEKEESTQHSQELANEKDLLKEKLSRHQQKTTAEQNKLLREQENLKNRLQEIQIALDQAHTAITTKEQTKAEIKAVQKQLAKALEETQRAGNELDRQHEINRELAYSQRQLERELSAKEEEYPFGPDARFAEKERRLRDQIKQMSIDYSTTQEQNMVLIQSLEQQIKQLDIDLQKQITAATYLKQSANDLADRLNTAQNEKKELDKKLMSTTSEVNRLQTETMNTNNALNLTQQKLNKNEEQLTETKKQLSSISDDATKLSKSYTQLITYVANDLLDDETLMNQWENDAQKIINSLKPLKEFKQKANAYQNIHNFTLALARVAKDKKTAREFVADQLFKFVQKTIQTKESTQIDSIESYYAQIYAQWTSVHKQEN